MFEENIIINLQLHVHSQCVDQWAAKSATEVTMPVLSDTVRSGFAIKCDLARLAVTFGINMLFFLELQVST